LGSEDVLMLTADGKEVPPPPLEHPERTMNWMLRSATTAVGMTFTMRLEPN
jgi:hypothetical protein